MFKKEAINRKTFQLSETASGFIDAVWMRIQWIGDIVVVYSRHMNRIVKRQKTRIQLKRLTSEQLQDIGISVEQARIESKKRFWE